MLLQTTISKPVEIKGVGLHTGQEVQVIFRPAPVHTGLCFIRGDLEGKPYLSIEADLVKSTNLATTVEKGFVRIATIEHCLSAVYVLGIDNLFIEVYGGEIPILDGSASLFFNVLKDVDIQEQDEFSQYIYIKDPITIKHNDSWAKIEPYNGLRITCTIDFEHPAIKVQTLDLEIDPYTFQKEIAPARTFGFYEQVEQLRAQNLIAGGSLDNAIILSQDSVMNKEGLRYPDEFVRHKILDALGDLATLGHKLMGHLTLHKPGHTLMNLLLKKLISLKHSYRVVERGS